MELDDYKSYPDTKSCYLDGRYFNKVFKDYPGLISEPLNIFIRKNRNNQMEYTEHMKETPINNKYPGLLRVIINTPEGRHSNLIIIDYAGKKLFRFDPHGTTSPYYNQISNIIERYFDMYIDFDLYIINYPTPNIQNPACLNNNIQTGFCVAYVIKYGYDYIHNRDYDPSKILKLVTAIETAYGPLPVEGADVEYGIFGNSNPNQGRNALIGGIGGGILAGVLTGSPVGVLIGGAAGALIGSAI